MTTMIESHAPTKLADANLEPRGPVHPSPLDWRDQVLYFLLPDRFSDGQEVGRPAFDRANAGQHQTDDKAQWMGDGKNFQGGTLKGVQSKLGYLHDLGITTLWIGPVWKQRADLQTYHGYGIQNFLDIDPRFGTRQDLRDLVDAAHELGMYVLLDIIYNHSGNNWFYDLGGSRLDTVPYRYRPPYAFHSWRSGDGGSHDRHMPLGIEDGVWPEEFQDPGWYTRAGQIGSWDVDYWEDPLHPEVEFRRGDFFDLKDLNLNRDEVLAAAMRVYQYWIALSDCDGFRIDTVKHVSFEGSRNFCGAIHEFAESIGKNNFLLLGEVTGGGEMAHNYLEIFGRNLDVVLDIGAPAANLGGMVKGLTRPQLFFDQYYGQDRLGSHRLTGRYHVSVLDDHDMVGRDKHRFAANNDSPRRFQQTAHAVATQLTTLGIPCVYYGTEQAFDGTVNRHDFGIEGDLSFEDRYIRESMFGGSFGAFETEGCHFFDTSHPTYLRIAAVTRVRNGQDIIGLALRRGRQYLRETSSAGGRFSYPDHGELIAWSRILYDQEVLVVLNTHGGEDRGAKITVDASLHPHGSQMHVLYHSEWSDAELRDPPQHQTLSVNVLDGRSTVQVDLPPAGMVILA